MLEEVTRGLRRTTQWLRYTIRRPEAIVVHHPEYGRAAAGPLMDPARADKILAFLTDEGLIRRHDISRPIPASLEHILRVHTAEYVESLSDPAVVGNILGLQLGSRQAQEAIDLVRLMVGGTIQATRIALRTGKAVVHLGGGFHHAAPDEGMGFCILNDVAIAIARLRARGFEEPILVVDLDLHDGNGTRAAFAADETVYTFSIHHSAWDHAEAVASTAIELGSGVSDEAFLRVLERELPPVVARHQPGLVIYVAGVDPAAGDALGDWQLSAMGMLRRDQMVVQAVRSGKRRVPLVVVLGGGYGPSAWRHTARFVAWLITGRAIQPPDDTDIVLRRFREISRRWQVDEMGLKDDLDWGLTTEDLTGIVTGEETRFLGQFSRHAIELQLEQLGLLNHLRARGFRHPKLTLDAPHGLGQVIRIYGDQEKRELLMELKAQRSRTVIPGFEVVEIEWLLLQNPRAGFSMGRPQLPGQTYPGLGLLREAAVWVVVICERTRFDGVAFVPSQFYMATVGHRYLRFVDPVAQARYEALRAAVRGLTLALANHTINAGGVLDLATGQPALWQPTPMVLPVTRRLREAVTSSRYRARVKGARAGFKFVLKAPATSPSPLAQG